MNEQKINTIFGLGLSKEEYERLKPIVAQQNSKTLQWASLLTAVLMLGLTIATLLPYFSLLAANRYAYFAMAVLSLAVYFAAALLLPRRSWLAKPLFYTFLAAVIALSIYIGVFTNANERASTICVLLFAIPLLITDKPGRI